MSYTKEQRRAYNQANRAKRKASGQCFSCNAQAMPGRVRCDVCARRNAERNKVRYQPTPRPARHGSPKPLELPRERPKFEKIHRMMACVDVLVWGPKKAAILVSKAV